MIHLTKKIQEKFLQMCESGKLFRVNLSGQEIWDLYLKAFTDEHDPVFRDPNSSTHNCNHCQNFMRRYGNIVAIVDNKIVTMFDVQTDEEYQPSMSALTKAIQGSKVSNVFFETFAELQSLPYESCSRTQEVFKLGVAKNIKRYTKEEADLYGVVKPNEIRTFEHLYLDLPTRFVDKTGASVETIMGNYRDGVQVFKRAMEEISLDTLYLVRDLIVQGSLLDGQTHLHKVNTFIPFKTTYDALPASERDNWCWFAAYGLNIAKFRNELIGTLCVELSEGKEINEACQAWNKRVDPANYMKATAPITKKQIDEAKKFVEENGLAESFDRRLATFEDIKASEIKHMNVAQEGIKGVSIFDGVKASSTRHKRSEFDNVEVVDVEKFMSEILPTCSSVEVLLKNDHEGNLVTLTTANNPNSKPIFKWNNNYSWSFNGNLAGKSQIKEAVKEQGGKVDGVLRFSIMWAEGQTDDNSDLDAWAQQPDGDKIGFRTNYRKDRGNGRSAMSGQLDVDITQPSSYHYKNIVENIVWNDKRKMKDGVYRFWVNPFSIRGTNKGFKAEIEFDGEIYTYEYNQRVGRDVHVAEVTLERGHFTIKHILPESGVTSKELYGLETNNFHKVKMVCLSPNHWDDNNVGNKHYLFMLEGCENPNPVRGFHNENLKPELLEHRKVMEVLGATNVITPTKKQLSGLGFNATVRDEVVMRLGGSFKRVVKVKF